MTRQEEIKEVGMVAAIIADCVTKKLYDKMSTQGTGYVSTVEKIADWAIEFVKKHKKTNWEKILEKGMKPLTPAMGSILCWDDAVIDFAYFKLNAFD